MDNFQVEFYYNWYSHNDMKDIGRTNIGCNFIIGVYKLCDLFCRIPIKTCICKKQTNNVDKETIFKVCFDF